MAIALDVANAGEAQDLDLGATASVTTTSAIAANALVLLGLSWGTNGDTLSTVTSPNLTWTIDQQGNGGAGSLGAGIVSAVTGGSGLASGEVISITLGGGEDEIIMLVSSFTGTDLTSSRKDQSGAEAGQETTWTAPSITSTQANTLVVGLAGTAGVNSATNTPDANYPELHDYTIAGRSNSLAFVYRITSSVATYTPTGTWSASQAGALAERITVNYFEGAPVGAQNQLAWTVA